MLGLPASERKERKHPREVHLTFYYFLKIQFVRLTD